MKVLQPPFHRSRKLRKQRGVQFRRLNVLLKLLQRRQVQWLVLQCPSKQSPQKLLRRKMCPKLQVQLLLRRRLQNVFQKERERKMFLTLGCSLTMYIRWRKQKSVRSSTNQKLETESSCLGICLSTCMALSFLILSQSSFNLNQCILLCTRLGFNICLVKYLVAMVVA
uniref:Translation initiation factor eIF-2B delta subunit n=1 Tax=Arundo donax TaxID=35708 RepID=A0A0A9CLH0_ARUDO